MAAVLIIGGGVTTYLLLNKDDPTTTTTSTDGPESAGPTATPPEPPNTSEDTTDDTGGGGGGSGDLPDAASPEGLGDDPELDALAQDCFDGDMSACDELFIKAPVDSAYEDYGNTCGNRVPEEEVQLRPCVVIFP